MVDATVAIDLFAETYALLKRHVAGLSHPASLRQLAPTTMCVNWLVGHIVATRAHLLVDVLDAPQIWNAVTLAPYIHESAPLIKENGTRHIDDLISDLDRSQYQLNTLLTSTTAETLQSINDLRTVGEHLLFYHAHEAYHVGQLEVLTQLARARM